MLMNNDVNMNNFMMCELNVLMKKCNYQRKEQYIPKEKLTLICRMGGEFSSSVDEIQSNVLKLIYVSKI